MTSSTQCYVWEFTLHKLRGEREITVGDVHSMLRGYCKAYTFQLERAPTTGTEHYQGCFSLFKKSRGGDWDVKFPDSGIHVSPTVTENVKGEAFYCMKAETRIEGPWTEKHFKEPKPNLKCIDLMKEKGLYPWQTTLCSAIKGYDARKIHVVIDVKGNHGKTYCMKWMWHQMDAQIIPPMNSSEDLVGFAMSFPNKALYVIDMPRAMKKNRLAGFYAGVETIKNGILYDKRYHGKFHVMDEPNIVVFTNTPPKKKYLSPDRWKMWTIKDNQLHIFKYDIRLDNTSVVPHGAGKAKVHSSGGASDSAQVRSADQED